MSVPRLRAVISWVAAQFWGFLDNVMGILREMAPDDVVPPSVWDTIVWFWERFLAVFGLREPIDQILSSLSLIAFWIVTSYLSLGFTAVFVLLTIPFFIFGVLRLIPFVDEKWIGLRDMIVPGGVT